MSRNRACALLLYLLYITLISSPTYTLSLRVDSATGGSVQAKHSYICSEIEWDKSFEFCVFRDPDDGYTTIDFSRFHELIDVSPDAPHAGPIASYI